MGHLEVTQTGQEAEIIGMEETTPIQLTTLQMKIADLQVH